MRRRSLLPVLAAVALLAQAAAVQATIPAWTTYRHDAARSGIDPDSTSPVTPSQAWQTPALDGEVYGQPLVYGPYVYVATENDSIYRLDAATGAVLWSNHLASPEPSLMAPCGDITPSIGITGTPVIDPATNRIYAVGAVSTAGSVHHELFALDLSSGQPVAGFPITVDPPFPSGGSPVNQLQRPGLAPVGNRILIGYGGNDGDCSTYWGWVVSVTTDGTTGLSAFQVDPNHAEGAIWGAGNAPTIDGAGNVLVATGNGSGNSSDNPDYGDAVVKLNAAGSVLDWWAPVNWRALDGSDADLGSSMPTLLPGGFLFQSGKDGSGYVVNGVGLGRVSSPAASAPGFCSGGSFGGSVYDPASATIYAACSAGLRALSFTACPPPSLAVKAGFSAPSGATGPPMIAGGLVWATNHSSGTLFGLDPASGATRSSFAIPEHGSQVNHFAVPSAGGGRLFVGTGDQVTAYTIAQAPSATATTTSLAASPNPVSAGTAVSLIATVAPAPDAGTVSFTDGGAPITGCSGIPVSAATAGHALCRTTLAQSGRHNLAASYSGEAYYGASSSAVFAESVTGPGAPPTVSHVTGPGAPPTISHASISPHRFKTAHRAKLQLTLTEAGTIKIAVTQLRRGHKVGLRCSRSARRGRSCLVRVTFARLAFHARGAGRHAFKLSLRHLAPGRYAALLYATDSAGRRSRTIRVLFTIIRG